MLFWMIVKVALKSLSANKLRSMLAMLGIIIGVGAVIAMLAIGAGAQQAVLDGVSKLGTNLLLIHPAPKGSGGVISGTQTDLTVEDGLTLMKMLPDIRAVAPVVFGNKQVKYMRSNLQENINGVANTYLQIRDFEIDRGRNFSAAETDHLARVALIGSMTADKLFGKTDPIGEMVKVSGISFKVIGLLKSKGDTGYYNQDDQIFIPYTTAMQILYGRLYVNELDVEGVDGADLYALQDQIAALIRRLHHVKPGWPGDVDIRNQAQILEVKSKVANTLHLLLLCSSIISLVVGGIGIMNIMLVTVTERTREIGIRKAIGARNSDVLSQFLIESLLMSAIGGLLGVMAGLLASWIISISSTSTKVLVTPSAILLGLGSSAAIGICFGFFPAFRAAGLDPIEALRYE